MSLILSVRPETVFNRAWGEREENKVILPQGLRSIFLSCFSCLGTGKTLRSHSNLTLNWASRVPFEGIFVELERLNVFSNSLLAWFRTFKYLMHGLHLDFCLQAYKWCGWISVGHSHGVQVDASLMIPSQGLLETVSLEHCPKHIWAAIQRK